MTNCLPISAISTLCSRHRTSDTRSVPWEEAAPNETNNRQSHEHGPSVMIDLDEAIGAIYILIEKSMEVFQAGNLQTLIEELKAEAVLLARSPLKYMAFQVAPSGCADFSVAMGSTGVVIILAGIAINGSSHNLIEAAHTLRKLSVQENRLQQNINQLNQLLTAPELKESKEIAAEFYPSLRTERLCLQQKLDTTQFALQLKRLDKQIGNASLASGRATFAKALIDCATQVGLIAATRSFDVAQLIAQGLLTGSAMFASIAIGVVSTLLGLLTASFAVIMGYYFVKKSTQEQQASRQDRANFKANIEANPINSSDLLGSLNSSTPVTKEYLNFLDNALTQREQFATYFLHWNYGFLTGSTIYAVSAFAHTLLIIAALAGAGAWVSSPAILGILLALAIVGSITMAACSQQFLFDYDQQKRYDRYKIDDDPELERDFLAVAGFELRAAFYQQMRARGDCRQTLLDKAAEQGKSTRLSQQSLTEWLTKPENNQTQFDFMHQVLEIQQNYLAQKIKVRQQILGTYYKTVQLTDTKIADKSVQCRTDNVALKLGNDKDLLTRVQKLLSSDLNQLLNHKESFIQLQQGRMDTEQATEHQDFAKYLLQDAPQRDDDLAGILSTVLPTTLA